MGEPMKWYADSDDHPRFFKALAEVRRIGVHEGWCYHHVQAILLSIDQYAEAFRRNFGGVTMLSPDSLQATPLTKVELANLKQASEQLHKQYDGLKTRAHELNQDNSTILRLKEKIKQCAQDLEKFNRQYDERLAEAAFGGTLQVVEDGGNPIPAGDKRKQITS